MIPLDVESSSELLRATHILDVLVATAAAGEWEEVSPSMQQRSVSVSFVLERVIKGEVDARAGSAIETTVLQAGILGSRYFRLPGVWSGHALEPGAPFVAFCLAPSDTDVATAGALLQDTSCFRVDTPEAAFFDVAIADAAGAPPEPLSRVLSESAHLRPSVGQLFARYVEARLPEVLYRSVDDFEVVMRTIEDPALAAVARALLITAVYSRFILLDPAPAPFIARLVAGTARLLNAPIDASLRANLLRTYMPNMLGLVGGAIPKSARDVFADQPERRADTESLLATNPDPAAATPILAWARG